jgi:outer membrane protein assembly factor BamB
MRGIGLLLLLLLSSGGRAFQTPSRSDLASAKADEAAIVGIWKGTATTHGLTACGTAREGCQTADVAFDIRRVNDGIGLFMTLPRLHAWRMPVGYLKPAANGAWEIADWRLTIKRSGDSLAGELGDPRVAFTVSKTDALPEEAPLPNYPDGPAPDWMYEAGAPLWASAVASDGVVFAADTRGVIHAVRTNDGSSVWKRETGGPFYGAPLLTADALFVLDDLGTLHKVERKTGEVLWRVELGTDSRSRVLPAGDLFDFDFHSPTPALRDGTIYIASAPGSVHAVDAASGQVKWKADAKGRVRATVGLSDSNVFVGTLANDLVALDRTTGTERWRVAATGPITSAPAVFGDLVLFANRGAWLSAVRGADGSAAWRRYDWFSWIESDGKFVDDVYYVGSSDLRVVRALNPRSGSPLWETDVLGWAWGTPAVTRDTVYIGIAAPQKYITKHAAGLVAIDRKTGAIRWRRPAPAGDAFVSGYPGSVAIDGNVLVAPNVTGTLEGYRLR